MAERTDGNRFVPAGASLSLTRLESVAVGGAALALASLPLPWHQSLLGSVSGFQATWLSPAFVAGALVTGAVALPDGYDRLRYATISLVGVLLSVIGIFFALGLRSLGGSVALGLVLFVLSGLLVAYGGYASLTRAASTLKATAVVCAGSLVVVVATMALA